MKRNGHGRLRSSVPFILSLVLLNAFASCHPFFTHPLSPPRELKVDKQILGTWTTTLGEHESRAQLSIFPRSSGWIDAVYVYDIREGRGEGIDFLVLEGYGTTVNKERFLCLRFREKDVRWAERLGYPPSEKGVGELPLLKLWTIVSYETPDNDKLIIKQFSSEKVERLIKEGKLKGQVQTKGPFPRSRFNGRSMEELLKEEGVSLSEVLVTSSPEELSEVISREGIRSFLGQGEFDTLIFSRGPAK